MEMLEKLKEQAHIIKTAPYAFILFLMAGGGVAYFLSNEHFSGEISALRAAIGAKESEISRYRVALGIDPASQGALVELNDQELALRAQSIVSKLRELASALDFKLEQIQEQARAGKIRKERVGEEKFRVEKEVAQDFDSNLASDAHNIDNELRRRLDPKAIDHIVRVPGLISSGTRIPLTELFRGSGFDTFWFRGLANEIEQMAKLLPAASRKP
jgi:hypothetical protein